MTKKTDTKSKVKAQDAEQKVMQKINEGNAAAVKKRSSEKLDKPKTTSNDEGNVVAVKKPKSEKPEKPKPTKE